MKGLTQMQVAMEQDQALCAFRDWLRYGRNYAVGTVHNYVSHTRDFRIYLDLIGQDYLQVDFNVLTSWLAFLASQGLSAKTISCQLNSVRMFYKFLHIAEGVPTDWMQNVVSPKLEKRVAEALSEHDAEALLNACRTDRPSGIRDRAMLELMYLCGLRVSEVTGLTVQGLDLNEKLATIFGKGSKERIVLLNDRVVKFLRMWMQEREYFECPVADKDIVFISTRGTGRMSRFAVARVLDYRAKQAGIRCHVHPHMMRHTFASHMLDAGADLRSIQILMGHESISTTERYCHVTMSHLRSQVERFHPLGSSFRKIVN